MKKLIFTLVLCVTLLLSVNQPFGAAAQPGDAPTISDITPNRFASGINTPVTITGANLDSVVSAKLGVTDLTDVQVVDAGKVTAVVPWSISPGTFDLTVKNATDQIGTLPGAVTISAPPTGWFSNGPYGGDLWNASLDPQNPGRLFVSGWNAGLFLTTNAGASWSFNLINQVGRVHFYYPAGSLTPILYKDGYGMMRSDDAGLTWQWKPPAGFGTGDFTGGTRAALHPAQPNWVFLTMYTYNDPNSKAGLYKSTNQGDDWTLMPATSGWRLNAVTIDPDDINHILVGDETGKVYTSLDGGDTWSAPIQVGTYIGDLIFAPQLFNGHRSIWAVQNDHYTYQGSHIYRSLDGGATWPQVAIQTDDTILSIAYHPTIPGLAWLGTKTGAYTGNIFVTEDDGATWISLNAAIGEINDITVVPGSAGRQTTTLYAATSSGMYKSTDGGTSWLESDAGLGAVLPSSIVVSPFNADEAFAAVESKGLLRTFDGGTHWQLLPIPIQGIRPGMAADPLTPGKFYFTPGLPNAKVYVSTDHGASYTSYDLSTALTGAVSVPALAAHPTTEGRLLAGTCARTDDPLTVTEGWIYASDDSGQTWTRQTTPAGVKCINSLTYDTLNPLNVYAGTDGGLFASTDGGANWSAYANQPNLEAIDAVVVDPRSSDSLYVASSPWFDGPVAVTNVFHTNDAGIVWMSLDGLGLNLLVNELQIVKVSDQYWLFAATMNGLRYLPDIPTGFFDPNITWGRTGGISRSAAVTGFTVASDAARLVFYVGNGGGVEAAPTAANGAMNVEAANIKNLSGGVYRAQGVESILPQTNFPGWKLKNKSGFGDGNNLIGALEVFDGQIYATTNNWAGVGCRIWRSADGSDWTPASDPGMSAVYGNTNAAVPDLVTFKGQLYASVGWGSNEGQIWRTSNGTTWDKVSGSEWAGGSITMLVVFGDDLYAIYSGSDLQVWRSSSGDSGSWVKEAQGGFGNAHNSYVPGAAVFNNQLYLTVGNSVDGVTVWSKPSGGNWIQVNTSGFGSTQNSDTGGMAVLGGYLYVGVQNTLTGGQLWRYDGATWSQVVGDGFGDVHNIRPETLITVRNQLFAITRNNYTGFQVWRSANGTEWSPLNLNGLGKPDNGEVLWSNATIIFNNTLYIGTTNNTVGGEIWQYSGFPIYLPMLKR